MGLGGRKPLPVRGLLKSMMAPARPAPLREGVGQKGDPRTILLFAVAIIAALHFGQDIFIPVAAAILLSFVLAPLVRLLRRIYVPRVPAVLLVVTLAFLVLASVFGVVVSQVRDLANNLPRYEYNLRSKIRDIDLSLPGDSAFERGLETLRQVGEEIERKAASEEEGENQEIATRPASAAAAGQSEERKEPQVVRILPQPQSAWQRVQSIVGPLFKPLATAGLIVVFVIFMLLKREDLRDRVIRLAGSDDVLRTTAALDDAAARLSRYLLMHLIINVTYGIPVAAGLWLIGVPNPLLWGLLATVLRFIPYAGPIIAAIMPIALAFAVDPGWSMVLMTIGLLIVLELFSDNVMEPWLYGSSTGLSSIAIIAGAVFWATLWGPIGLLLATPLTVCLVVLGRHVPQLGFIDVLLGSTPALTSEVKLYQRLLAGDVQELEDLTRELNEDLSEPMDLEELCDELLLPVLALAEQDRRRGGLTRSQQEMIGTQLVEILDELIEDLDGSVAQELPKAEDFDGKALCLLVAARSRLDEAAGAILCRLLQRRGVSVALVSPLVGARRALEHLDPKRVDRFVICYVAPPSLHHPRRMLRRLRAVFPAPVAAALLLVRAEGAALGNGELPEDVARFYNLRNLLSSQFGEDEEPPDTSDAEVTAELRNLA